MKISEMVLYHVENVHYDLIVPKDSIIAKEGGLDFHRKHNVELVDVKQKSNEDVKGLRELNLERQISKLEGLLKIMEEKVKKLEAEKANRSMERQYNCVECDKAFKTRECVKKHMEIHNKQNQKFEIECDKCDCKYNSENLLQEHVKTHSKDFTNDSGKEEFNCEKCNSQFRSKEYLENHMLIHKKNPCETCGTCFWSEKGLERHIKEFHSVNESQATLTKSNDIDNFFLFSFIFSESAV